MSAVPSRPGKALSTIAVAASGIICGARDAVASLDLSSVMVGAAGEGAVVVDALVERASAPGNIR